MKISVVIPVYNAEIFIEKAVLSALKQDHLAEIILVDDGSKDTSYSICEQLANNNNKIRLFHHPSHEHYGVSKSRNLGISKARSKYISFLDADDRYHDSFFNEGIDLLKKYPEAKAVFGSMDVHYHNKAGKQEMANKNIKEFLGLDFTYRDQTWKLTELLIRGEQGYFSIIGTIFNRDALLDTGLFDESLDQSEDTDLLWRFSLQHRFVGINHNIIIAHRGIHGKNTVLNDRDRMYHFYLLNKKWIPIALKHKFSESTIKVLIRRYLMFHPSITSKERNGFFRRIIKFILLVTLIINMPGLFLNFWIKR